MKEDILEQFDNNKHLYDSICENIEKLLTVLLRDAKIPIHQITNRTKSKDSLIKKIDIKSSKYSNIAEITDIAGVRIITYLESDVDRVAKIVENEFMIDTENSVDKRNLNVDQFGYKSLHYVVEFSKERLKLSENKKFNNIKVEIQIRSILQHAWAEIEHDLGYKGEISIPADFKRAFNRISALLESADIEFDRLKREIHQYEINIEKLIEEKPNDIKLNQVSLSSFVKTNKTMSRAREIIGKNYKCTFIENNNLIMELEKFEYFNISTIAELENIVNANANNYLSFVDIFTKKVDEVENYEAGEDDVLN
jgi:ppGpp synthetase/RelA/SpoT-type nucleotidyltranferase